MAKQLVAARQITPRRLERKDDHSNMERIVEPPRCMWLMKTRPFHFVATQNLLNSARERLAVRFGGHNARIYLMRTALIALLLPLALAGCLSFSSSDPPPPRNNTTIVTPPASR